MIILWLYQPFNDIVSKMINISGHPEINTVLDIVGSLVNLAVTYYFLWVLQLGWLGLILVPVPYDLVKLVVRWIYVNKKLLKMDRAFWRDIAWQVFVAPICAGFGLVGWVYFILATLWPIILLTFPEMWLLIGVIIMLVVLFLGVVFIYLPLYSWFGGWDDRSMEIFKRSVAITGPSLFIVYPMYKIFNHFHQRSPFKKKAYIALGEAADQELLELSLMRYERVEKFVDDVQSGHIHNLDDLQHPDEP
jgi:hypothetical protein